MEKKLPYVVLLLGSMAFAQNTISFNGCHNLFGNQDFLFTKTGVDSQNKNIYITMPVEGDQSCGGLGTCEFTIQWNHALTRWEFLADAGNGDFVDPYVIYYNSTGNNSASNPPANNFGTWVENTAVTENECGGNLSGTNSVMTGDVHDSSLATSVANRGKIQLFPNPVVEDLHFSGEVRGLKVQIYTAAGQLVKTEPFAEKIKVNDLAPGVYILKVLTSDGLTPEFKFIKK